MSLDLGRRIFKIAGKQAPFRLFPIPVIEDKKFLIECSSLVEAKVTQKLLELGWISFSFESPELHWQKLPLHDDGRTQLFKVSWGQVHLNYLKGDSKSIAVLESVLSRYFSHWALAGFPNSGENWQNLRTKIQSQKACKSCQSFRIQEVDFDSILNLAIEKRLEG